MLVTFPPEDHPHHVKPNEGNGRSITKHIQIQNERQANDHAQAQDDLENIVARTRLSMSACTKPTDDFKENTSPIKQPATLPRAFPLTF